MDQVFSLLTNRWTDYYVSTSSRVKTNSRLCQHHGQSILLDSGWSVKTHVVNTLQQLRIPVDHQVKNNKKKRFEEGKTYMCSSACGINDTTVKTHSLSSSNVFTEYRGEVGSRCWTSTWFLFRTRERRISLFKRDCSARSTLSPSFNQPTSSVPMLPEQVERKKTQKTPNSTKQIQN